MEQPDAKTVRAGDLEIEGRMIGAGLLNYRRNWKRAQGGRLLQMQQEGPL